MLDCHGDPRCFLLHQNVKHLETSWATSDLFVFRHLSSSCLRFVRALCFNCETPGGHGSMVNIASPNHRIPLSEHRILKYPKISITIIFRIISWPIQKKSSPPPYRPLRPQQSRSRIPFQRVWLGLALVPEPTHCNSWWNTPADEPKVSP